MPKLLISPIKGPPVLEKASVNPQNCHWKDTTAMTVKPWKIMESADFLRAMPPYNMAMPGMIKKTKQPRMTW